MTQWPEQGRCAFTTVHPAAAFAFFAVALVGCMVFANPVCEAASFLCAALLYGSLAGTRRVLKLAAGLGVLVFAVAALMPLFNAEGATVLFRWWGGRPYTLEAMALGATTGLMLATMLLWFASFHEVVTADKFTFLFGRFAPAVTMVLTLVLRLVPSYGRRAREVWQARAGIGKAPREGASLRLRVEAGATVLGLLSANALEDAVVTADSLRSRGYGLPGRTVFSRYRWTVRDGVFAAALVVLALVATVLLVPWGFMPRFFPAMPAPLPAGAAIGGLVCYGALLLLPALLNEGEKVSWRLSLSRM